MEEQINHYKHKLTYETDSADLFDALEKNEPMVVLDTRSAEAFEQEHIPGAYNLPHRTISTDTTKHLNPATTYVTYCDGIGCNASTKGAYKLSTLGFKVKELIGGMDWWKRDGYATRGLAATSPSQKNPSCAC